MLGEARRFPGNGLLLLERARFSRSAQANPLRPKRHSFWLTIQPRSPTIRQLQYSAERGDKDRCDEKQPRQQACAPLSHERLTPNLAQNHSNVSECSLAVPTLPD